jgi:hypothetical protein
MRRDLDPSSKTIHLKDRGLQPLLLVEVALAEPLGTRIDRECKRFIKTLNPHYIYRCKQATKALV